MATVTGNLTTLTGGGSGSIGSAIGSSVAIAVSAPQTVASFGENKKLEIRTTHPPYLSRHDISDEELTQLEQARRGRFTEPFWGVMGLFLGLAAPAVDAIHTAYFTTPRGELTPFQLAEIVACAATLAVAVCIFLFTRKQTRRAKDLVAEIRARPT